MWRTASSLLRVLSRHLVRQYGRVRELASHWGAVQLTLTGGGVLLFVGVPGALAVASSVHPLVAAFSTLGGLTLLSLTSVAIVGAWSLGRTRLERALPWGRSPRVAPAVVVYSEGVRWTAEEGRPILAECDAHEVELVYRRYRLGWRGWRDGAVEPVVSGHRLGRRGTLYCPSPLGPHRVVLPDSGSYAEAACRAEALVRAERRLAEHRV